MVLLPRLGLAGACPLPLMLQVLLVVDLLLIFLKLFVKTDVFHFWIFLEEAEDLLYLVVDG